MSPCADEKPMKIVGWLEKNIHSKNGKEFNFPKHKLFKQAEALISHLLIHFCYLFTYPN